MLSDCYYIYLQVGKNNKPIFICHIIIYTAFFLIDFFLIETTCIHTAFFKIN